MPALTLLPRPWPRALPADQASVSSFLSCAHWTGSSGPLWSQNPDGQGFADQRATHQTRCFSHEQGEVPAKDPRMQEAEETCLPCFWGTCGDPGSSDWV